MHSRLTLPLVAVALIAAAIPAALAARTSSSGTISVTAGVPRELAFKVSPTKVTSSPVLFKVTNKGKLPHSFKVCTKPSANDKANTCTGVATKPLAPGTSATLVVNLPASGAYEYLSGKASEAAGGMKGLLTVAIATATSAGSGTTAGSTSSGSKSSGSGSSGGVLNGAAVDPACPPGTTVPVGPNTGDQDDDNEGGFPTDNDGCL